MKPLERTAVELAGLRVVQIDPDQLVRQLASARRSAPGPYLVGYLNAHVFNSCWRYTEVYQLLRRADLVYADGASIGWAARLTGQGRMARSTSADWLEPVLAALVERGKSLFLVGGAPGMVESYVSGASERYPSLRSGICGTMHGFFSPDEDESLMHTIAASGADILVVGMGTPWQEQFVLRNLARLPVQAVWWIGAGMEYATGNQSRGPAWTRAMGHEWLGRLISDPRRLAGRYLLGNPLFLWRVLTRSRPAVAGEP